MQSGIELFFVAWTALALAAGLSNLVDAFITMRAVAERRLDGVRRFASVDDVRRDGLTAFTLFLLLVPAVTALAAPDSRRAPVTLQQQVLLASLLLTPLLLGVNSVMDVVSRRRIRRFYRSGGPRVVKQEFKRADREGWLAYFSAAAERHKVRPEVLMAIASRETNMGGPEVAPGRYKWLTEPGDRGNGFGIMQVDRRSFPEFAEGDGWQSAELGIEAGARVLAQKVRRLVEKAGQLGSVTERRTGVSWRFTFPALGGPELERVAVASYNSGDWAPYHRSKGRSPDRGTTGGNYSEDVLRRAEQFKVLLDEHGGRS